MISWIFKPSSFAIVFYQGKILFILRDDIPNLSDPNKWSLPGGGKENNETPEQTMLREVWEEISVRPKNYHFLYKVPLFPKYLYLVKLTREENSRVKLGNEGQKLAYFALEETDKLSLSRGIRKFFLKAYRNYLTRSRY